MNPNTQAMPQRSAESLLHVESGSADDDDDESEVSVIDPLDAVGSDDEAEHEILQEIFEMCDTDEDGLCDLDEIRDAFDHAFPDEVKGTLVHEELMDTLAKGVGSSGGVDFNEFRAGYYLVMHHADSDNADLVFGDLVPQRPRGSDNGGGGFGGDGGGDGGDDGGGDHTGSSDDDEDEEVVQIRRDSDVDRVMAWGLHAGRDGKGAPLTIQLDVGGASATGFGAGVAEGAGAGAGAEGSSPNSDPGGLRNRLRRMMSGSPSNAFRVRQRHPQMFDDAWAQSHSPRAGGGKGDTSAERERDVARVRAESAELDNYSDTPLGSVSPVGGFGGGSRSSGNQKHKRSALANTAATAVIPGGGGKGGEGGGEGKGGSETGTSSPMSEYRLQYGDDDDNNGGFNGNDDGGEDKNDDDDESSFLGSDEEDTQDTRAARTLSGVVEQAAEVELEHMRAQNERLKDDLRTATQLLYDSAHAEPVSPTSGGGYFSDDEPKQAPPPDTPRHGTLLPTSSFLVASIPGFRGNPSSPRSGSILKGPLKGSGTSSTPSRPAARKSRRKSVTISDLEHEVGFGFWVWMGGDTHVLI